MAFKEAVVTESEYRAAVYHQLKELGVCIGCRRADAIKGMVYCPECRAKMLAYQTKRRNRLKREGICLTCQSEPAVPGTTKCTACRDCGIRSTTASGANGLRQQVSAPDAAVSFRRTTNTRSARNAGRRQGSITRRTEPGEG